jgi:hypothetical protein
MGALPQNLLNLDRECFSVAIKEALALAIHKRFYALR